MLDYVQLDFDGPCLTAWTVPTVRKGDETFRWGDNGYRDALCACIAHIVSEVSVVEGERIVVIFDDHSVIEVSLRNEDFTEGQVEAAMFMDKVNKEWMI